MDERALMIEESSIITEVALTAIKRIEENGWHRGDCISAPCVVSGWVTCHRSIMRHLYTKYKYPDLRF